MLAIVCVILASVAFYLHCLPPSPYNGYKRIGKKWPMSWLPGAMLFSVDKYVQEGYAAVIKPLDKPFVMKWWALDYLFMPAKYLDDLKIADKEALSFFQNISDAFCLHASVGNLYSSNIMIDVVTRKLNPQLPNLIPVLAEERDYAFRVVLGDIQEWKDFNASKLCGEIMHRTTSRILVGDELCRDDDFIAASMRFGESVFFNAVMLTLIPLGPFRKIVAYLGSFFHRRKVEQVLGMLIPIIEQRLEGRSRAKQQQKSDAMQWTIEISRDIPSEASPRRMGMHLIQNLFAGSGAPGSLVTQILFQLLMEPDYVDPLRSEAERTVSQYGWTETALNNMPLLDSFLLEMNRLYPAGCATAARTVQNKSFEFHDGLTLPAGTRIVFPVLAIQQDPDNFQDPLKFDGYRFARAQESHTTKETGSMTTVSKTNLAFGYGKHSCVGRYYTSRKVKLIVSKLLMEYEFKWKSVVTARPPSFSIMGQFAPNMQEIVLVRKRTA